MHIAEIKERRGSPRVKLSQSIRVRPAEATAAPEVTATYSISQHGIYFLTSQAHYFTGMFVRVTRNFAPSDLLNNEEEGDVVRVDRLEDGRLGVAVRLFQPAPSREI